MRYYFAPMEGITTYIYRRCHKKYFKGVDVYFTPFVSPTVHGPFTPRERKDLLPENNAGVPVVPQVLTNKPEYFLMVEEACRDFGYQEINLNLGCPSNTVAKKGRGSGFLSEPYALERFLDTIFEKSRLPISIKTRIGRYGEDEWEELLDLFNGYPIKELTVHPRVQQDFYKAPIHWDCFLQSAEKVKAPLCYNGDVNHPADFRRVTSGCSYISAVMFGRGLLANPMLLEQIREEMVCDGQNPVEESQQFAGWRAEDKKRFWQFQDELFAAYQEEIGNNVLFKMKELWIYMQNLFPDGDKYIKKIKKAKNGRDYQEAVQRLKAEEP